MTEQPHGHDDIEVANKWNESKNMIFILKIVMNDSVMS
jgi:hypothetical protein